MNESAFMKQLENTPLDHVLRCAYADWLEENDRPEEADRQRKWIAAYEIVKEFTREHSEGWEYDEDGNRIPGSLKYTPDNVIEEVNYFASCAKGTSKWGLCFSTDHAADSLEDANTRKQFWEAVYIMTGVHASEELASQERYRCAC